MSSTDITLYHYWRSSCSWRVRWALAIKKTAYTLKAINLLDNEHHKDSYLSKNPNAQVPCLKLGNDYFSESLAMLEWLEELYPKPPLLPKNPYERMRVRELSYLISSGVQPLQNLKAQRYFTKDIKKQHEYACHWIRSGFNSFEKRIKKYSQTYSYGSSLTIADLCLIPQIYNGLRFGIKLEEFPLLASIYERCLSLDSCQNSAPEKYR